MEIVSAANAGGGAYVDNVTVLVGTHGGQYAAAHKEGCFYVCGEYVIPFLDAHFEYGFINRNAGAVHKYIYSGELGEYTGA